MTIDTIHEIVGYIFLVEADGIMLHIVNISFYYQEFESKFSFNLKPVLKNTKAVKPVSSEEVSKVRRSNESTGHIFINKK